MSSSEQRVARARARMAEADSPWRRFNVAKSAVSGAVEYAADPEQVAGRWIGEVVDAARLVQARLELGPGKQATCDRMLAGSGRYQLSEAMTCLHMLIGYLDPAERDEDYEQHATQLLRIAVAIEEGQ